MSATGRNLEGHERRKDDFYETPEWCTRAILPHLRREPSLDPCCGKGAILDVIKSEWEAKTFGIEIDEERFAVAAACHDVECRDALIENPWPFGHRQIITNPPYTYALDFILQAAKECPDKDRAFLLRINFLASQRRATFHRLNPCDLFILPKRPSFTNGGTDATEYAWFVWGPGRGNRWQLLDL